MAWVRPDKSAGEQARAKAAAPVADHHHDNTGASAFTRKSHDLSAVHLDAMEESRRLKPQYPIRDGRIPLFHEIELSSL
jgi:hypothetical protein